MITENAPVAKQVPDVHPLGSGANGVRSGDPLPSTACQATAGIPLQSDEDVKAGCPVRCGASIEDDPPCSYAIHTDTQISQQSGPNKPPCHPIYVGVDGLTLNTPNSMKSHLTHNSPISYFSEQLLLHPFLNQIVIANQGKVT